VSTATHIAHIITSSEIHQQEIYCKNYRALCMIKSYAIFLFNADVRRSWSISAYDQMLWVFDQFLPRDATHSVYFAIVRCLPTWPTAQFGHMRKALG